MAKDKWETRVARVLSQRCPGLYKELFNELFSFQKEDMCSPSPESSQFLAENRKREYYQCLCLQILSL